jgi:aminoglycoside phosphotransferase (APT) family kinase protein
VQRGVLWLVQGLVPAPRLVELVAGPPAVLVTTRLPGVPLLELLRGGDSPTTERLGAAMGPIMARLSMIPLSGPGSFLDHQQTLGPYDEAAHSLLTWLDRIAPGTPVADFDQRVLRRLGAHADELLSVNPRAALVHGDLSPRNVLAEPDGSITGVVDWEFVHAGHPLEDLGKMLRKYPGQAFSTALIETMSPHLPPAEQAPVSEFRERARAADLYWLIELSSRKGTSAATDRAHRLLSRIVDAGELLPDLADRPG